MKHLLFWLGPFHATIAKYGTRGLFEISKLIASRALGKAIWALRRATLVLRTSLDASLSLPKKVQSSSDKKLVALIFHSDNNGIENLIKSLNSLIPLGKVVQRIYISGPEVDSHLQEQLQKKNGQIASIEFLGSVLSEKILYTYDPDSILVLESGVALNSRATRNLLSSLVEKDKYDVIWGDEEIVIGNERRRLSRKFPNASGRLPIFVLPEIGMFVVSSRLFNEVVGLGVRLQNLSTFRDELNLKMSTYDVISVKKINELLTSRPAKSNWPGYQPKDSAYDSPPQLSKIEGKTVSVLIPTRDKLPLLMSCVNSVLAMNLSLKSELIILDNGSVESETLDYLSSIRKKGIKVLRDPSRFNFSRLINIGAREASGDLFLLLNNDVVLDHCSSLEDLVAAAINPSVGAVGIKLLFPEGTVQHAGVSVPSLGSAGHMLRGVENDASRFPALEGIWPVEAVTGAFLMVERLKFNLVGGLDEELAVGLNDIDFCLKLSAMGLTNYVNCDFSGTHAESASRGSVLRGHSLSRAMVEIVTFRLRWIKKGKRDRFSNPSDWAMS